MRTRSKLLAIIIILLVVPIVISKHNFSKTLTANNSFNFNLTIDVTNFSENDSQLTKDYLKDVFCNVSAQAIWFIICNCYNANDESGK